ncbi:hypothetical protein AAY473_028533 [Plecturocebus cupreus]
MSWALSELDDPSTAGLGPGQPPPQSQPDDKDSRPAVHMPFCEDSQDCQGSNLNLSRSLPENRNFIWCCYGKMDKEIFEIRKNTDQKKKPKDKIKHSPRPAMSFSPAPLPHLPPSSVVPTADFGMGSLTSISFNFYSYLFETGLECSGTIIAHYNLDSLSSSDPPALASRVAAATGVHHHTWLIFLIIIFLEMRIDSIPKGLNLSPRLKCSGVTMVHCSLNIPGASNLPISTSQRQGFITFPRLVLNTWAQAICLPQPLRVLGLEVLLNWQCDLLWPMKQFRPGDPQAEQPHGRQRGCFGRRGCLAGAAVSAGAAALPAPRRGGSPHKIHWSVCPLNWRVELREGGLKGD